MSSPNSQPSSVTSRGSRRWWLRGVFKAGVALTMVYVPLALFESRYRIVYDAIKGANCLPYSVFLVDTHDVSVHRGDYLAFVSKQMEPFYLNGTLVVKLAAGVPGDHVAVDATGVRVNGVFKGALLHLQTGERLWSMGRRITDVLRDETVPAAHVWMMGTHARSFDSRYWGYIERNQVVGRAIPLF